MHPRTKLSSRALAPSLFFFLATVSCSTPGPQATNPDIEESPKSAPGTESITILGTNDIHGAMAPLQLKSREASGTDPVDYEAGGLAYLTSYVKKLRSELGDRFMWLDAGDEFQGTIESNASRGAAMVKYFNFAGLTAAAVGNHEFDFGAEPEGTTDLLGALKNRMAEAHYPYLAANIYNKATGRLEPFPNTLPSKIFQAGKLKVGVIGLSTVTTPTTTRPEHVATLKFGNLKEATLREAKSLRRSGAQVVVITAHAGLFCDLMHGQPGHVLRKPSDPQGDCESDQEIVKLLKSLPAGTVDAVVAGHTHSVVHHYVAGVPVIEGGVSGRYFNLIHLTYDLGQQRVVPEKTRIEGPVPVCPLVFRNQGDCNGDRVAPSIGRGPLVHPVFHRQEIRADEDAQAVIEPALIAAEKIRKEVFGQAARPIDHDRYKESVMGDLVADAIRDAAQTDFALVNSGGIRANFEQGPITYGAIFRVLPFDNSVVVLRVNGKQLKQIVRVAESGSRGFHSLSGLKARIIARDVDAPADDLDKDGKIEPWEIDRLLEVRTSQGAPIDDHKQYTLATLDFLVSGGDDYAWAMSQIPKIDRRDSHIFMRDAAAAYIRKLTTAQGALNSETHPILNVSDPRFVFERPKAKKGKSRHKRHHRRRKARSHA